MLHVATRSPGSLGNKEGQGHQSDLLRGIVLSPDELAAHVQILRSQAVVDSAKQTKPRTSESSGFREVEVVFFNDQKSSVYVFDGNSTEDAYVVLEVRGCEKGGLLLPPAASDNEKHWSPPENRYLHLANYLVLCMSRLQNGDWSDRISMYLNDETLVRYQAVVREKDWRTLWEALLKPFGMQRTAYRGVYKTQKAPDLFFGVNARFSKRDTDRTDSTIDTRSTTDNSSEHGNGKGPLSNYSEPRQSIEGIPLPTATEWLEFWGRHEIPTRRTFIEFASDIGTATTPTRSNSSPDLSRTENSQVDRMFSL
jgi:hypothetical protein